PKPLSSISITPNSVSVIKGDVQKFIAVGKDIDGVVMDIKGQWQVMSIDGKTEIKGAISSDGVFTATGDMNIGTSWKIRASAINNEGKTIIGEAIVNIIAGSLQTIEILCDKNCDKPIESGKVLELTANGYDKFRNVVEISPNWKVIGQIGTITQTSKNKAILTASVIGSGEVIAESGGKEGRIHLTVVQGKLVYIVISVVPKQSDEKIGSTASNPLIIKSGTDINFIATGFDSDKDELGNPKVVNSFSISPVWSVQTSNLGTITSDGKFTAKSVGDGYISAKLDNISAKFYIKVTSGQLYSIRVSPSTISLISGKDTEYKFTAIGYDQQGNQISDFKANWKTIGGIGDIDETGLLKVAGLPSGTSSISGSVVAYQGAIEAVGMVRIVIAIGELSKITITIEPSIIKAGGKAECFVKGFDDLGNSIADLPSFISFNVSDSLGSLTPSQNVWIFQAIEKLPLEISNRKGKITASVEINDKVLVADADFSLIPADLDKIAIEPSELVISAGEEWRFKAYGYDAYGNIKDLSSVDWAVLGGIGKVTKDLQSANECLFIAEKMGKCQLIAISQNYNGKADIQVNYGKIETLEIQPKDLTIESGNSQKFTAFGKDRYGNVADDLKINWQVIDENVGTITDDGIFTAKKIGNTKIKALYGDASDSVNIEVIYGSVSSMEIIVEYEGK
ncbi:MAG: Ig-like domain-containing protein, partial [Candidatus Poribacteria bacterium]